MRINQSAEGAERHSPKPSLPLSLSDSDIDPSLSAHHQHPPATQCILPQLWSAGALVKILGL